MKSQAIAHTCSQATKPNCQPKRWSAWSDNIDDLQCSLDDTDELRMLEEEFADLLVPVESFLGD